MWSRRRTAGVKDHGSRASIFGKFAAGESERVRPDLPGQPTFRTGSIGAPFGNDEDSNRYQLHDEIEAKVAA